MVLAEVISMIKMIMASDITDIGDETIKGVYI